MLFQSHNHSLASSAQVYKVHWKRSKRAARQNGKATVRRPLSLEGHEATARRWKDEIPQARIEYYLYVRMKTYKVSLDKDSLILVESPFFVKVLALLKDGGFRQSICPYPALYQGIQISPGQGFEDNPHPAPLPQRNVEYDSMPVHFPA